MKARLYFDGAAKGNPGPGASSFILVNEENQILFQDGAFFRFITNNQAEYNALLSGLRKAHELGIEELEVIGDSQLVLNQVQGKWKVKDETLRSLCKEAQCLLKKFKHVEFKCISSKENKEADKLCKKIIKENLK